VPIRTIATLSARDIDVGGGIRTHLVPPALHGSRAITLLIHGFNNSQPVANGSYRRFLRTAELERAPLAGQICAFFWPGDHGVFRYFEEIDRAKQSAAILRDYLVEIAAGGQLEVSLVCHSLGNRLALELIAASTATHPNILFVRAAMMAAAVPLHVVDRNGTLHDAATAIARHAVLYSRSDEALGIAFLAGQLRAGEPCLGAVGKSGGPPGLWSAGGAADFTPYAHGDYWPEPESALTVQTLFGLSTTRYLPRRSRLQRWLAPLSTMPRRETPSRMLLADVD
jgi:hypothetical protein